MEGIIHSPQSITWPAWERKKLTCTIVLRKSRPPIRFSRPCKDQTGTGRNEVMCGMRRICGCDGLAVDEQEPQKLCAEEQNLSILQPLRALPHLLPVLTCWPWALAPPFNALLVGRVWRHRPTQAGWLLCAALVVLRLLEPGTISCLSVRHESLDPDYCHGALIIHDYVTIP